jgi:type I restriction enzyme R subunit
MNKKDLSERNICSKFIGPAVKRAGWDGMKQIREEVNFTKGRIIVRGKLVTRGKAKRADYILYYKPNIPIAIIEAKDNNHGVGSGMQQAPDYAVTLNIPLVFSSNGDGFIFHDRTGTSMEKEPHSRLMRSRHLKTSGPDTAPGKASLPTRKRLSCRITLKTATARSRATISAMPSTPR